MLNKFLKEHSAAVEERQAVQELKKQVAGLSAGVQKVHAELQLTKRATQTVLNNR